MTNWKQNLVAPICATNFTQYQLTHTALGTISKRIEFACAYDQSKCKINCDRCGSPINHTYVCSRILLAKTQCCRMLYRSFFRFLCAYFVLGLIQLHCKWYAIDQLLLWNCLHIQIKKVNLSLWLKGTFFCAVKYASTTENDQNHLRTILMHILKHTKKLHEM